MSVKTASLARGRMSVEIWRDGKILCRVFAESVHVALEPRDGSEARLRI